MDNRYTHTHTRSSSIKFACPAWAVRLPASATYSTPTRPTWHPPPRAAPVGAPPVCSPPLETALGAIRPVPPGARASLVRYCHALPKDHTYYPRLLAPLCFNFKPSGPRQPVLNIMESGGMLTPSSPFGRVPEKTTRN